MRGGAKPRTMARAQTSRGYPPASLRSTAEVWVEGNRRAGRCIKQQTGFRISLLVR